MTTTTKFTFIPAAHGPGYYNVHVAGCSDIAREWRLNNSQAGRPMDRGDHYSAPTADEAVQACIDDLAAGSGGELVFHREDFHLAPCCKPFNRKTVKESTMKTVTAAAVAAAVNAKGLKAHEKARLAKVASKSITEKQVKEVVQFTKSSKEPAMTTKTAAASKSSSKSSAASKKELAAKVAAAAKPVAEQVKPAAATKPLVAGTIEFVIGTEAFVNIKPLLNAGVKATETSEHRSWFAEKPATIKAMIAACEKVEKGESTKSHERYICAAAAKQLRKALKKA